MSLFKRNGIWYYDFMINGKRFSRTTGERSKVAARQAEDRVRREVKDSLNVKPSMTLKTAINRAYRERWNACKDSEQPVSMLERIAAYLGADTPIHTIQKGQIENVRAWLDSTGAKPSTVNRYMAALKTLLRMAYREWEVLQAEPYVPMRPERFEERRALTDDELKLIGDHLDMDTYRLVFFLADTGMRLGEALGLRYEDIRDGCAYLSDTKNGKPRVVPLTKRAKSCISAEPDGRLFRFKKWRYARAFRDAVSKAGVDPKGVCLHSLRHTCCTKLVTKGAGLAAAGAVLGHSSGTMTRRYSHLDVTALKATVNLLE